MNLSKHELITDNFFASTYAWREPKNWQFYEPKLLRADIKFEHEMFEEVYKLELNHLYSDRAWHVLSSFFDEYVAMRFDNIWFATLTLICMLNVWNGC